MNDRKLVIAAVLAVLVIVTLTSPRWHRKPATVPPTRLHVLAVGDSVQWGGVKGEIVSCCVVPHGKTVIVEIRMKGE